MLRLFPIALMLFPALALAELEIGNAWIKNLPPAVPVRAGYMTIRNPSSSAQRIVAVDSTSFASVEIHQSLMRDGMMRMEKQDELLIGAGATVKLEPGGLHLMMMGPLQPTKPGEVHRVNLELGDGSTQPVDMTVRE